MIMYASQAFNEGKELVRMCWFFFVCADNVCFSLSAVIAPNEGKKEQSS